ncbi:aspartate aminotransferase family protein [Desulfurella sp.]|uniref:aspartate aminotransferase family protein n=2 Tax=Desulfurella sp. TaxID=1962857 RepID=UPI0025BFED95|nr:aspartate aminotransferase family protein [Desulfurella sp.]
MDVFEQSDKYTANTYKRAKVCFDHGKGMYLYDNNGNAYLDFLAGIAVNILGHSHDIVVNAICEQAKKLIHVSNLYYIKEQAEAAQLLVEHSCADKVFFCNSGAEANEAAIKLARLYSKFRKTILTFEHSFHGRTITTLAATGQKKYQEGFEPITQGFVYAKFNDIDDFYAKVNPDTCAVMIEFIQGEGGINQVDKDFVKEIINYCKKNDILLIDDEIQTGMGRTSKFFAYEIYDCKPDIITLAKGLAAGVPIGAMLAKDYVASAFMPGSHGSTFGGNPLATKVSSEVINFIFNNNILSHVKETGEYFINQLLHLKEKKASIKSVKGIGLIVGISIDKPCEEIVEKALENKILIGKAGNDTLRFEPPLIVEKEHIDRLIEFLDSAL